MFAAGVVLFTGGLITVISRSSEPGRAREPRVQTPAPAQTLGPQEGEDPGAYIARKQATLKTRAAREGHALTVGVVSFDGYRKVADLDSFLSARKYRPELVFVRIPLPRFDPEAVRLEDSALAEALSPAVGKRKITTLQEELTALEELIPTTEDPEYRAVYEADAENLSKAIALLRGDPTVVFGFAIETSFANFGKLSGTKGVRLADVPATGTAGFSSHVLTAIQPD